MNNDGDVIIIEWIEYLAGYLGSCFPLERQCCRILLNLGRSHPTTVPIGFRLALSFKLSPELFCHSFYVIAKLLDYEINLSVVEQNHAYLTSIVLINHSSPHANAILPG